METQGSMGGWFSNALTSLQVTPRTSENVGSVLKAEGAVDKASPSLNSRPASMIEPPKMVGAGLMLDIKKMENGTLVHNFSGVASGGAAAESARIAVNDQLVVVNGKRVLKTLCMQEEMRWPTKI